MPNPRLMKGFGRFHELTEQQSQIALPHGALSSKITKQTALMKVRSHLITASVPYSCYHRREKSTVLQTAYGLRNIAGGVHVRPVKLDEVSASVRARCEISITFDTLVRRALRDGVVPQHFVSAGMHRLSDGQFSRSYIWRGDPIFRIGRSLRVHGRGYHERERQPPFLLAVRFGRASFM
jgi:hypothetical protein